MGRKLATFFRQLKHLSFTRMKLHINAVHEETGKNRLAIFCDMVWCEVRYGIGYLDYHVFGFANRRGAVRKTYMTAVQNQALTRQMNDPAYFYQLNDKIEFDTIFSDLLKRRFLDLRKTDAAGLRDFCAGTEAIFCKPAGLCGGEGIQRLITADIDDYDALYDRLVKGGQLLIEEPIRQHPDMNKLCPDSVNTVRIVTLVTAQGAQMVYALVRMGMGGVCVDNVSSGGMYAPVNEHGQLYRPAFCDKTGKYYEIDWREADLAACIQDDFDGDGLAVVETYFANVAAVAAKKPTILGHFDLIKKVNGSGKFFDESDPRYTAAAHKALEAAAQAGCVLEVNTSSVYRGFREDYFPSPAILKEWLTMGGNVTITADAHEAKALTFGFEEAAAQLKELGYTRVLVLGKDGFAPCEL